ncbi:MAG: hypothetical protein WKG07_35215 [Hymenobacter sp.]
MKSFRFPHPLVLLTLFIILAAGLSYVLPAGAVCAPPQCGHRPRGGGARAPTTRCRLPPWPRSTCWWTCPRACATAGAVVFLIFLAGGAFTVVDQTGALRYGVDWLLARAQGREVAGNSALVSLLFATMGALENMGEEIIALVPVLLVLMRRLGYPALTAVAASAGGGRGGRRVQSHQPVSGGRGPAAGAAAAALGGRLPAGLPGPRAGALDWGHHAPRHPLTAQPPIARPPPPMWRPSPGAGGTGWCCCCCW